MNEDMTSSHSEKEIYNGCIALMEELKDRFCEYLDFIGVDVSAYDESFRASFSPFHIVQRLFLYHTTHAGGTSTRMKMQELGIDDEDEVTFDFSEELENMED